jgi:putative acetyltransferase
MYCLWEGVDLSDNSIIIRKFQSDDVDPIKHLMDTTINTSYMMFPHAYRQHWMDEHHSTEQIIAEATAGYTLIIEYEGRIIGTGNLRQNLIQSVLIHPNYQRQGYGTSLIHRLEAQAQNHGVNTIHVTALTPSKSFFERLGYQLISKHNFNDENLKRFQYYSMAKEI